MFILWEGRFPAIMCPYSGVVVVRYPCTAAGFSLCLSDLRAIQKEIGLEIPKRH